MKKKYLFLLFALSVLILALWPFVLTPKHLCFSEMIRAEIPFHAEWETRIPTEKERKETAEALAQSYRYLGAGGQCLTFVSQDEKYVIKFFKQKAFFLPPWLKQLPLPYFKEKKERKRYEKRNKVFSAFKLCFDHLPEETGLIYIHLNTTDHLKTTLTLVDRQNALKIIDLDTVPFVIQRKAELAYSTIDNRLALGDIEGAKKAIDQLFALHIHLYQKGFRNRDANFRSNCGFIQGKAILIDVGRVVESTMIQKPKNIRKEIQRITPRLRRYLQEKHPELLSYLDQSVAKISIESS